MQQTSERIVKAVNRAVDNEVEGLSNQPHSAHNIAVFLAPIQENIAKHIAAVAPKELALPRDELGCLLQKVGETLLQESYHDDPKLADKENLTVTEYMALLANRMREEIGRDREYYEEQAAEAAENAEANE